MCGRSSKDLVRAEIEGVEMIVCKDCARFGKILGHVKKKTFEKKIQQPKKMIQPKIEEEVLVIRSDYPSVIKKAREKLGMKQSEFAKLLKEKESVIHKLETGEIEPSIGLARKLEKVLKVRLIEKYQEP